MDALKDKDDFRRRPHRYEIVNKEGEVVGGVYANASAAAAQARIWWPDQEQDEERSGKGWDVQVVGAD